MLEGYTLESDLRRDREDTVNGLGGGLLIYTRTGIAIRKSEDFKNNNFNQFVAFTVLARVPLNLILIYRPPNSGRNNLDELCSLIDEARDNTILIGDFNLPEINWRDNAAGNRGRPVLNAALENNFEQLVNFATHNRGNTLDLVLSNCSERIHSVEEAGKLGNSDHVAIEIKVKACVEKVVLKKKCTLWKRADYHAMRNEMGLIDWESELGGESTDRAWGKFKEILDKNIEKHVPTVEIKDTGRPKWLSRELVKLIRRKKKAWKQYRLYGTAELANKYEELQKEVKNKIRKSKRKWERDIASNEDRNGKKFTEYVRSKTKSRTGIGPLKKEGGGVTTDCKEMAEILNKFMASVFTKEDTLNVPTKDKETDRNISDITITAKKIEEKIDKLKEDSSPGPDNIHPKLLKELKTVVSVPLQIIFRKSLDSGTVPDDWRTAKVVPIYKKGTRGDPGNYRPVSLTSVPCKLLESLIKDEIMDHLLVNN
jgi:hypothetical protein